MNCARSNRIIGIDRLFCDTVMIFVTVVGLSADEACAGKCEFECSPRAVAEPEACGDSTTNGCYVPTFCDGPSGNCCHPHDWTGCEDPVCSDFICSIDPFCCYAMWDNICASEACQNPTFCDCAVSAASDTTPFVDIQPGEVFCGTSWSDGPEHDSDWYCFEAAANGTLIECVVQSQFAVKLKLMKQYCVLQPIETVTGECSTTMTAVVAEAGAHCLVVVPAPGESVSCQDLNSYAVSFTILQVCYADIEPSGVVDVDDLLLVINSWGSCEKCVADLMPLATGNGVVNVDDLLAVINSWGTCN